MKKTLLMLALVAGITSFAQNAQAALITIDIGPTGFNIGGTNGGVSVGSSTTISNFPISLNNLKIYNNQYNLFAGLAGSGGLTLAASNSPATPVNFALNASIGVGPLYVFGTQSFFKGEGLTSPDFGPGSYMGFKTSQNNYGWLEVTWTASSGQFQILSGAYESVANTPILAGAQPIPEPSTWAMMAIFAGGAAFAGWRRRKSAKVAA